MSAPHARRRQRLMEAMGEGGIAILPAAPERIRSRDTHWPYRQDSDFWYLTGFAEPDAVLVLVPGRAQGEAILFLRERDTEREGRDGPRLGPDAAAEALGLDDAYPIDDLDDILPGLLEGRQRVHVHLGRESDFDIRLIGWVNRVRARAGQGSAAPHEFISLGHLLDEQRLFKSADELKLMQRAVDVSVAAHQMAMRVVRPGMGEWQLQAEAEAVMRREQMVPAYGSIIAGGANACTLHYVANAERLRDGALVLIDAGAEHQGYAADLTRTFPVNGRFSREQRVLHELVSAAQHAAIAQAQPHRPWTAMHEASVEVLTEGLHSLGLLKGSLKRHLAQETHKRFTRHKTGHWLGLDVHDVGDYRIDGEARLLEPGMVFTVEPGLYIRADDTTVAPRWRGIGIRTEDDLVVTRDGHRVLSAALIRDAGAIEDFMAQR